MRLRAADLLSHFLVNLNPSTRSAQAAPSIGRAVAQGPLDLLRPKADCRTLPTRLLLTMELGDPRQSVRQLLVDMLAVVDSSPDSLEKRYSELRDGSYSLALQVRTAAMPEPYACREAFVSEVTGRRW